jgi:2-oxoglutarate dehydrogenase E1 component
MEDFESGTRFQKVIPDTWEERVADDKVRKVIFCSGQVYYDLINERKEINSKDVAIVRLEQFSPFPWEKVTEQLKQYKNADFTWAQEEHKNMGAYQYVDRRFDALFNKLNMDKGLDYSGRLYSASTATGWGSSHKQELKNLLKSAFS